MLCVE
jgi:hypothetical protein